MKIVVFKMPKSLGRILKIFLKKRIANSIHTTKKQICIAQLNADTKRLNSFYVRAYVFIKKLYSPCHLV